MRLKLKAKESGEPVFIRNNNQASKGREGWDIQNFRTVEVTNFAIQLRMRHRTFTRPFIVRVLSQGKPMKNTVLQNIERAPKVLHEICMRKIIFTSHTKRAIRPKLASTATKNNDFTYYPVVLPTTRKLLRDLIRAIA